MVRRKHVVGALLFLSAFIFIVSLFLLSGSSERRLIRNRVQKVFNELEAARTRYGDNDKSLEVVFDYDDDNNNSDARTKADYVKGMMRHAWEGYVAYAWGFNEVRPVSMQPHTGSVFGAAKTGATIVDSLDTLFIMGMRKEFDLAAQWIQDSLDFDQFGVVSLFETNIRYLGGLLSAFALTGDPMFKNKAVDLANRMLSAFDTPTGVPYAKVNLKGRGSASGYGSAGLSEFGTLHLEFAYLSDITGDQVYMEKMRRIREAILKVDKDDGLYPVYFNPKTGDWSGGHVSIGAMGDSFYEYLIKEWLRSGKSDPEAYSMFTKSAEGIESKMVRVSSENLWYLPAGSKMADDSYSNDNRMEELTCFSGGMYALASMFEEDEEKAVRYREVAEQLTHTCHQAYLRAPTHLAPEAFQFNVDPEATAKFGATYYIQRPETAESYFVLWRLTKDPKYRDWGWEMVKALEKHCKVSGGYSGLKNVNVVNGDKDDVQQSFLLAETLKYLYLLFSDDSIVDLKEWVFNTEAHPLPVKGMNKHYRAAEGLLSSPD